MPQTCQNMLFAKILSFLRGALATAQCQQCQWDRHAPRRAHPPCLHRCWNTWREKQIQCPPNPCTRISSLRQTDSECQVRGRLSDAATSCGTGTPVHPCRQRASKRGAQESLASSEPFLQLLLRSVPERTEPGQPRNSAKLSAGPTQQPFHLSVPIETNLHLFA